MTEQPREICGVVVSLLAIVSTALLATGAAAAEAETVVLLHGMGRTSASMLVLKYRLETRGYRVVSETYASTSGTIDAHARWLGAVLERCCLEKKAKTHFVTHSLGGIVVRKYLAAKDLANLGRVVMLSPPSHGSELADLLKKWKIYRYVTGPSGQELGTDAASTPNSLGPVDFELGVITGDASFNPLTSLIIPGPDDGTVSVARAQVEGMKDFLVVDSSHTFIMNSSHVAAQVVRFLQTATFLHPTSAP